MTYVVTDNCIKCKYTDCVEVCPVDCFFEGEDMLVIDPELCIDCGVCVAECPAGAIFPESEELIDWVTFNRTYAKLWPVLTAKKPHNPQAKNFDGEEGKNLKYLSDIWAKAIEKK